MNDRFRQSRREIGICENKEVEIRVRKGKKSIRRSFVVDVDGDGNPFDVGFESSKSGLLVCDNKWPVRGCDCP